MSLQGSWNRALGIVAGIEAMKGKGKQKNEPKANPTIPEPGTPPEADIPPQTRETHTAWRQEKEEPYEGSFAEAMNNESAALVAEQHLQQSDTARNNLDSTLKGLRDRSTRAKLRRNRELRKKREGKGGKE